MRRHLFMLFLFCLIAAPALAQIADEVNPSASPFPNVIFGPNDAGWYYTPDKNYRLTRISTKFGQTSDGRDTNRVVSLNIYTDRPAAGGQLIATSNFNSSIARNVFGGVDFNVPIDLTSGTTYFIGILNVQNLALNITSLDNNCQAVPGVENLGGWATSGTANDGQFAETHLNGTEGCAVHSFGQPILRFHTTTGVPTPTPTPTPKPTPVGGPEPTPVPTPLPCDNDQNVPQITGAHLPFSQTIDTPANEADIRLDIPGYDDLTPDAVWYFTAPSAGRYQFSLSGCDATLLVVDGSCCEPSLLSAYDFSFGGEYVAYALTAGRRVLLVAKGEVRGDVGRLTLKIEGPLTPPINDACADAIVIAPASLPYVFNTNTTNAADGFDSSLTAAFGGTTPDLWWKFTPTVTGKYEIRATGFVYDVYLSAFTGACGALTQIAAVQTPYAYYGEHLVVTLTAGTQYSFLVETPSIFNRGPLRFEVRGPGSASSNGGCATATVINPAQLPFDTTFDTTFNTSTRDGSRSIFWGGGGSPDAWFRFTPTVTGRYVIGLRAVDSPDPVNPDLSLIDESLTLFTGSCGSLVEVESRDEHSYGEIIIRQLTAGVSYTILAEGFRGGVDFGRMRLYVDGPSAATPNNTCAGAITIPANALPYETIVNTLGNTSAVNPSAAALYGGGNAPDAFYRFTPTVTGTYTFEADLSTGGIGANIDVTLGIYTANCANLVELASVDDGDDIPYTPERLSIRLTAGTPVFVVVDGYNNTDGGPITLRVKGPYLPSANDRCSMQNTADAWVFYK